MDMPPWLVSLRAAEAAIRSRAQCAKGESQRSLQCELQVGERLIMLGERARRRNV
jgi:hypothetical protein